MGKKTKAERKASGGGGKATSRTAKSAAAASFDVEGGGGAEQQEAASLVPGGGPLLTRSATLSAKLDELVCLAAGGDRAAFVAAFVPLDLSAEDAAGYLGDLTTAPEAEGQWTNLVAEMGAISAGLGVTRIEGDQATTACFFFAHPLLPGCDREVAFRCVGGEWRAEG